MNRTKTEKFTIYLCGFIIGIILLQFMPKHEKTEHKWHSQTVHENHYPQIIRDSYDREITIERQPRWFSSLSIDITEILISMNLEDHLRTVSEEHSYSNPDLQLPLIGSSQSPDIKLIKEIYCDVLFTDQSTLRSTIKELEQEEILSIVFSTNSLENIYFSIRQIALITGIPNAGIELIDHIEEQIEKQHISKDEIKSFQQLASLIKNPQST